MSGLDMKGDMWVGVLGLIISILVLVVVVPAYSVYREKSLIIPENEDSPHSLPLRYLYLGSWPASKDSTLIHDYKSFMIRSKTKPSNFNESPKEEVDKLAENDKK